MPIVGTRRIVPLLLAATLAACGGDEPPPPPTPVVKVATVLQRDVPINVEAVGETRGSTEIEVRARVEGFLEAIHFEEGSQVRQGQLLYTIDPRPFEAALARARGDLAGAEADLARATQDVERYAPLVERNAIPREQYETAVSVQRAAQAAVEAARAMAERAELDLGYTRVTAPESGLVGKTEVYPGTLVGRGESTLLTRISQVRSIHVRFTLPERDYLRYARAREAGTLARDTTARMELILADGSVHPHRGRLVFVDRNVDPSTGTILLEAAFPNPGGIVRPGQFARVRAAVEQRPNAILVPQRAVSELQGVYNVAVVGAGDSVEIRMVQPGDLIGSLRIIEQGLSAGDRIVVEGIQKVRPGIVVQAEAVSIEEADSAAAPAGGA